MALKINTTIKKFWGSERMMTIYKKYIVKTKEATKFNTIN